MRSRQLDRTFSRLTTEIPAFIRVSAVSEDGECVFTWISFSELQHKQMPAAPDVHLSEAQISVRREKWCAGAVFCCLKLMYYCLCLQTSAGCCQEEQPDGSFPVGGVWQLGLQDLTGHSAGESGRRSHYYPAQTCHGGRYVHVKTRNWLKHSRSKI